MGWRRDGAWVHRMGIRARAREGGEAFVLVSSLTAISELQVHQAPRIFYYKLQCGMWVVDGGTTDNRPPGHRATCTGK
eukprot:scaffold2872_cov112-Isochrysis_galbana.AAC.3